MGFILFTESGTFEPAIYGLKAGDVLHVKVVGGGGGGGSYNSSVSTTIGTNGSASSFGSVLTAAGGLAGGPIDSQTIVAGSNPGCNSCTVTHKGRTYWCGGTGGDGWMPGYSGIAGIPAFLFVPRASNADSTSEYPFFYDVSYFHVNRELTISYSAAQFVTSEPNTLPYGHAGRANINTSNNTYTVICAGGVGYGAGGGTGTDGPYVAAGTKYGYGGNGGVIADTNYVLPDTSPIDVTVGAGGSGYKDAGGGGANGCVAIWW